MGWLLLAPAWAQLLMVTGDYQVTDVDRRHQRIGIALRGDDPGRRQNWVYIKANTVVVRRERVPGGGFRDEFLTFNGFFEVIKKGSRLRVHGGRDWDGTIDAKKIWF